jgi:hypothetical protein
VRTYPLSPPSSPGLISPRMDGSGMVILPAIALSGWGFCLFRDLG